MHLSNSTGHIIARVGGGYEDFRAWLGKNIDSMEKSLVSKMVTSRESLEAVCQLLIDGKPIRHHSLNTLDSKKWGGVARGVAHGGSTFYRIEKRVVESRR